MRSGFSLVELSIVLVILGLLTGGILAGQNLIRAAELRSVTTQLAQYQTAVMTFRDKYFSLPGDMINATKFWGTDPDGCPSHGNWQTGKTATCDGDGGGTFNSNPELFRFWQHLAAAELIEGSFSGVTGPTNAGSCVAQDHVMGVNVPQLRMNMVGVGAGTISSQSGATAYYFAGNYGNLFTVGKSIAGCSPINPAFSTQEAWNMDVKLDDGKPGTGKLLTRVSCVGGGCTMPNCNTSTTADAASAASAAYKLDYEGVACAFYYRW